MSLRHKNVICAKILHLSRQRPKHVICAQNMTRPHFVDVLTGNAGHGGVGSVLIIFDQYFSKISNLSRSSVSASTAVGHDGFAVGHDGGVWRVLRDAV